MAETETVDCSAFDADKSNAFDAEAALLALGAELAWKCTDTPNREEGRKDTVIYRVNRLPLGWRSARFEHTALRELPVSRSPHYYGTRLTAKAACERHYATGKWD